MEDSYSLLDEADRLPLLKAICGRDYDAIRQFVGKYPNLSVRLDKQGNTPLHYAVATLDQPMIEFLVNEIGADPSVENCQGKTTLDWWRSVVKIAVGLKEPADLKTVVSAIVQDDYKELAWLLAFGPALELPCIYQEVVQQPMHVAIRCASWRTLNMLLYKLSAADVLNNKDSSGQTPLMLVEEHQSNPDAMAALKRMRDTLRLATDESTNVMLNPGPRAPINPWFPGDYKHHLASLSEKFSRGIRKDDFPEIQATLPTLCCLTHLACLEALRCPWESGNQLKQTLLQQLSGNASNHLRRQIEAMRTYLEDIIQQDLINQLFEISDEFKVQGWTMINSSLPTNGKIYINPLLMPTVGEFWSIIVHELTHAAVASADYAYAGLVYPGTQCMWDFNPLLKLATTGDYPDISPETVWVLDTLWLLENKKNSAQPEAMTLAQFRAVSNADTIAIFITCCLVCGTDLGQVNLGNEILTLSTKFPSPNTLEKIRQQYTAQLSASATTEVPEVSSAGGGLSLTCNCFSKQHIKSCSTSEVPKTGKSFTSLMVEAGNNSGSPGDSSVSTASTAGSPLLPQQMAALLDTGEAGTSAPRSATSPEGNSVIAGFSGRNQRAKSVT